MNFHLRPYLPSDRDTLARLLAEPAAATQWEMYAGPDGPERLLSDPYIPAAGLQLAFVDGEAAGFAYAILLPSSRPWCMLRGAVREPFRRRGIGRALHEETRAFVERQTQLTGIQDLAIGAAEPFEVSGAFVESLGYRHDRWFWYMARPRAESSPAPIWPDGVTVRTFDGSDEMIQDWNDAYNDSFSSAYRFVESPLEHAHTMARQATFRADGLLLAYRGGRVAGLSFNELHLTRGEVSTLGVVRSAQGLGLGRALLRWGVGWIERSTSAPVTLLVDGENENALRLYRSEGFEVSRSRRIWAQPWSRA